MLTINGVFRETFDIARNVRLGLGAKGCADIANEIGVVVVNDIWRANGATEIGDLLLSDLTTKITT